MLAISHRMMLPSRQQKEIGTSERPVSQLNTQPMVSPVNASRQPSRTAAHHSGPKRLARPYFVENFHLLSFASLSWRTLLLATSRSSADRNLRRLWLHHRTPAAPSRAMPRRVAAALGERRLPRIGYTVITVAGGDPKVCERLNPAPATKLTRYFEGLGSLPSFGSSHHY